MPRYPIHSIGRGFLLLGICALLMIAARPWGVRAMPPPPPLPPDTPTPTPSPTPAVSRMPPIAGGSVRLEVVFPATWPWAQVHWQSLRLRVQWQDQEGTWHNTNGWYGCLDTLVGLRGYKTWWISEELLGRGPFRWVLYAGEGTQPLVVSEAFTMPNWTRGRKTVTVELP